MAENLYDIATEMMKRYKGAPPDTNETANEMMDIYRKKTIHPGAEPWQPAWKQKPAPPTEEYIKAPEKPKRDFSKLISPKAVANLWIPLIGLAETIASKGRSPGTGAMTQANILQGVIERGEERDVQKQKLGVEEALRREAALKKQLEESGNAELVKLRKKHGDFETPEGKRAYKQWLATYKPKEAEAAETKTVYEIEKPEKQKTILPKELIGDKEKIIAWYAENYPEDYSKMIVSATLNPKEDISTQIANAMALAKGKEQVIRGLGREIPASQATELGDIETSVNQLDNMMNNAATLNLQFAPSDIVRALNPWDTEAKGFQQVVASTKQVIGKGLEGGVLRKEDEYKYAKIIPQLGDTREVLQRKYEQLRSMLQLKHEGMKKGLGSAGFDIKGFGNIPGSDVDITKTESPIKANIISQPKGKTQYPVITTKEEFDKLNPGDFFREEPSGPLFKKVK